MDLLRYQILIFQGILQLVDREKDASKYEGCIF